ncbi:MFS transporter [Enterococcus pseudoavium]|uniref:MFS transporter n=1 Tax=Enterococcus pseudoavium TaxID=44007 RepID=A0ABU3FG03_9ENTE|nr:MFS transporter [Enterococcus pseudoavium]MDT2754250.1 MFS transporter [Enterococcus pseudoavium]MDT2769968.1 MFS transporter [Enterococcus pseudoavium]
MKNRKMIFVVFIVALNLRLGISSIPPLIVLIKRALQLNNFQVSLLTSIPVICMGIMAFGVKRMQQRFGRDRSILFCLLLLAIGMASRIVFTNYWSLILSAIVIGFSIAIIGPLLSGLIKEYFPQQTGLLIGIYSISMGVGSAAASNFSLSLARVSWSFALGSWSILAIIAGIVWSFTMEKKVSQSAAANVSNDFPLKKIQAWKMVLFFGLQSGMFYGVSTWLVELLVQKGIARGEASYYLTLFVIIQMIFSFVIPVLMDHWGSARSWIVICGCLLVMGMGCLFTNTFLLWIIGILIIGFGLGGYFPIAMLLPLQASEDPLEASLWTGMVQSFGYIVGGAIPILLGIFVDIFQTFNVFLYGMIILSSGILLLTIQGRGYENDEKSQSGERDDSTAREVH